jgi:Ca-activated chloride channel homolog
MRMRLLAGLAMVTALWGCSGSHQATEEAPTRGPRVMNTTGYEAGRFDPDVEKNYRAGHAFAPQEDLLIVERAPRLRPQETPRGGSLTTRVEDRVVPLPLKHTDVKAQLALYVASVTLTQQYHNPYGSKIEAVYTFPLPDDAGVRDFVMQIGERRIRGIVREREEARRIYLDARRRGHVASLLTQDRPNIFTQAVANIEPGKQIDVQITYFHTLRYQDGVFEFVFPMVVGPRYTPPGFGQTVPVEYLPPGEISTADIALEVTLDGGADITSPTHKIRVDGRKVTLSPNDRIPNRDFVLRYRLPMRALLATHDGHFALMIQPPDKLADVPRSPREMIFVVDCSGSMDGRPLEVARRALVNCLRRLQPDDTFRILRFSDHVSFMSERALEATAENVRRGIRYAEELQAGGGTQMQEVVRVALDTPAVEGRYRLVTFLTDGFIGNDREVVAFARDHLGSARIFSFGVGNSVNRYLLESLARVGRGVSTIITLDESTEKAADDLFRRLESPAMTDLKIQGAVEVHPQPLPDLFVGRPVVVTGRYKGEGKLRVTARAGDRHVEMDLSTEESVRHPAIATLWARNKIASLHDSMFGKDDSREQHDEIRRVALQYGLLSDYTSFVAVDSLSRTEGTHGTTVIQPVPVPDGVKYETTVEKKK